MPDLKLQNAKLHISAGDIRQFPAKPVPQIALSGRSNVGKSSLINTLLHMLLLQLPPQQLLK